MKNNPAQLEKANEDYKAKFASQSAKGGNTQKAGTPAPPGKANAVTPDYTKFMKLSKPIKDMSAAEKKKVLCRFFVQGTCSKGKDCTFGHYDPRDKSKKHIALFPEGARKA